MDRINRTCLSSVVFVDVVDYTVRTVAQQTRIHDHLKELIAKLVRHIPEDDRVMVDTGDGAAVCFMMDPEEALYFGLNLREALLSAATSGEIDYRCRIGINIGPVKVVRDVNGRRNALGDGINVAQRVMDFAAPNQLLVSRAYFELLGCLYEDCAKLFSYLGVKRDKHIKEYEIYEVAAAATMPLRDAGAADKSLVAQAPTTWAGTTLEAIARDLADYIGPLATLLVQREARRTNDVGELRRSLAESIVEPDERERFLSRSVEYGGVPAARAAENHLSREHQAARSAPLDISDDDLAALTQYLADSLGPIAKVLVKRFVRQVASREDLVASLAGEIPDGVERERFLRKSVIHI